MTKFRGQNFDVTMKFKDGVVATRRVFASSRKRVPHIVKKEYSGRNGLKKVIKIKSGTKWYR